MPQLPAHRGDAETLVLQEACPDLERSGFERFIARAVVQGLGIGAAAVRDVDQQHAVAVCRIGPGVRAGDPPRVKLIGHLGTGYPKAVRAEVLRVMEGEALPAAEMSRLNWRLGEIYADCVEKAATELGVKVGLVGCHGQTVHHETRAVRFLGATVRSTWQIG